MRSSFHTSRIEPPDDAPPRIVEHYAGGFGGWHFALKALHQAGATQHTILALEHNMAYATQYALTHQATLVADASELPAQFVQTSEDNLVLCTEIQDSAWQKQIASSDQSLWTLSPPCQPW